MIEVNYNEYKETIAENMELIVENDRLKKLYETDKESWKEQMYELQERIDKALYWLSENTHYTSLKADKLIQDDNTNLLELLEILDKGE